MQKLNPKRALLFAMLGSLLFLVIGCEWPRWLRLLSLKKQLAHVERSVRIDDQDGLTLHFLKPVVYADDLRLLIADETSRLTNGNRLTWVWTFEKQFPGPGSATTNQDLSFAMLFENFKFDEVRFPKPFLALMPKPLILGLLRSFGQAEVDIRHGSIKMKWVGPGPNQKVELPTKTQVITQLGAPFWITETNGMRTYLYKYYQKVTGSASPAERLAWAKFVFAGSGEEIASSSGVIGNVGWQMTRITGQAEPQVTFALVPLSVEPVVIRLPAEITDRYVGRYREPAGMELNFGRDGDVFVASWKTEHSAGWCAVAPEQTNSFFGVPGGLPRGTFLNDSHGVVTGLVAQVLGSEKRFVKFADDLPAGPAGVELDRSVVSSCVGRYKGSWGGIVLIHAKGGGLLWQNEGVGALIPLYPASDKDFFFKAVDSPLTFVRNEQGAVTKFVLHFSGHDSEAVKLGAPAAK